MKVRTFAAALMALACISTGAATQDLGIRVGEKAPTAILESLDGKSVDLANYIGKKPVLMQFWATWCGNCKALEPAMKAAQARYRNKVQFVGVAVSFNQSPERVKLYAKKHGMTHPILYDRTGDASEAYDVPATSYIVVIDATGTVVYTGLGAKQDIDKAIRKAL
jgi:peroxiredoxin